MVAEPKVPDHLDEVPTPPLRQGAPYILGRDLIGMHVIHEDLKSIRAPLVKRRSLEDVFPQRDPYEV